MRKAAMKEVLEIALKGNYLGFHLYGAGMDVRVAPGHYNGRRMVGTVSHILRVAKDGVNYYLCDCKRKHDVFSFNICQGFDYEMNHLGDFTISRAGVTCTLLTHLG
jgi:hypothetical protein